MSKLTKEEIIKKYTEEKEYFPDDDSKIEFMEDVTDSMVEESSDKDEEIKKLKEENERLTSEVSDIKTKYKERFLTSENKSEEKIEENKSEEKIEEPEEKTVIDIKEI